MGIEMLEGCPLCGQSFEAKDNCSATLFEAGILHKCGRYNVSCITNEAFFELEAGESEASSVRKYNCIVNILRKEPYVTGTQSKYWHFYYDIGAPDSNSYESNYRNIAQEMRNYPTTLQEKVDSVLLMLAEEFPKLSDTISPNGFDRALYYIDDYLFNPQLCLTEIFALLKFICELGYLRDIGMDRYQITAKGWQHIYGLQSKKQTINQGFIAMSFGAETTAIGDVFEKAIWACGYAPRRIDKKEHNNQIVPEIFYEIQRSEFMVVDVTYPNFGAYYEAGYGEALGKEIIVCCSREVFDSESKPHFDIAQKSAVVWEDLTDLENKLKKRIEATVGLRNK